jgi:hypothetical protein
VIYLWRAFLHLFRFHDDIVDVERHGGGISWDGRFKCRICERVIYPAPYRMFNSGFEEKKPAARGKPTTNFDAE